MGAGVTFNLTSGLEYDVHITIDKRCVVNNVQPHATHLYLGIFSSCTILVKDSNFTYANRITDGDPMELVPAVQPDIGILAIYTSDQCSDEYGDTAAIDVEIVMNAVHIAENVGGGLHVSLVSKLPQGNIQLKLKGIAVVHNFLVILFCLNGP